MHFLDNPFAILKATPYDNDEKIMRLANEGGLFPVLARCGEAKDIGCREAKDILTHPRKRICAEIAWLPVKTREQAKEICELLKSSEANLSALESLRQVEDFLGDGELIPIAKCNVLAAGMHCLPRYSPDQVATWTLEIALAFDKINIDEVRAVINDNRKEANFPIANLPNIGEVLSEEQAHYYRRVMTSAMNKLSAEERAATMTTVVESAIYDEKRLPSLIDDLVDHWHENDARKSLVEYEGTIKKLDAKLRAPDENCPDSVLSSLVKQLIQAVKDWERVAKPIQVSRKSRGLSQDESKCVAQCVQDLAMHLFDAHDKLNFCMQLIGTIQGAFNEVNEISNRLSVIMSGLNATAQERERCRRLNIESQVEKLREDVDRDTPDSTLRPMVDKLIQYVKKWKDLVKLCEEYYANFYIDQVARHLLELAHHFRNQHEKREDSRKLFEMLQEEFAELSDIATLIAGDIDALERARLKVSIQGEKLRAAADARQPDTILSEMATQLIRSVNEWKALAQPIEAYYADNNHMAYLVQELAGHLLNEHGKLDDSRKLLEMIQEEFTEVDEIAVLVDEHLNTIVRLERARSNVKSQGEKLRDAADAKQPNSILSEAVNQLIQAVNEWKARAQPIQAYNKDNYHVAYFVFELARHLLNEHGKLDESRILLKMLQEEFAEVDEIAVRVAEPLDALEAAESARRQIEIQVKELRYVVYAKHYHPDLRPRVNRLIQSVNNWKDRAQPIKAYCGDYCNVAKLVLGLAVNLRNKNKCCSSRQLTEMLQDIFGEIPKIATLLAGDAKKARDETEKKHAHRNARRRARWRR